MDRVDLLYLGNVMPRMLQNTGLSQFLENKITPNILSLLAGLCLVVSGCSSTQKNTASEIPLPETGSYFINSKEFVDIPSIASLSSLLPEQKDELNAFIARDSIKNLPKRNQVVEFIQYKMVNFNYEGLNYNTSQAWQNKSGNCMALAMLTYGVAKYLDVRAVFQVVHSAPLLTHISNDLVVSSDHVRTFLYETDAGGVYVNNSDFIVIDYFPDRNDRTGGVVSDNEFLAMFYRNLAADALLNEDLLLSYALLEKGLSLAPKYTPLINMMAIVHRRVGDFQTAEDFYLYGLHFESNSLTLLSNYSYSLIKDDRVSEATAINQQLLELENESPYGWYSMGIEALRLQEYSTAEIYFKKFIKNTPYYHQAYYELAKAQSAQGKVLSAKNTLKQALDLTSMDDNQQKYLAKLNWLKQG